MTNVNSSEDYSSLLNALNDFTLTVLSPIPNNSHLLSYWYKFKPLLNPESYDSLKIQSFISSLDSEPVQSSFKKPPLSTKLLSEAFNDPPIGNPQPLQTSQTSRLDSSYKGEVSCEVNKRSGNSTQSSTSSISPINLVHNNTSQETQPLLKDIKDIDLSVKNDLQYYHHSKSDKPTAQFSDAPTYRRGSLPMSVRESPSRDKNTTRLQYSVDERQQQDSEESSRRTVRKYEEILEGGSDNNNAQNSNNNNAKTNTVMTQRGGDDSHPDPPTPPRGGTTIKQEEPNANVSAVTDGRIECPAALDFLARILNKPYSAVAEFVLYTKLFVLEARHGKNTFYYSLALQYFLYLLSDKSTSLAMSNLYEKVVVRRLKFSPYPNSEKLYENVTTTLKTIIREKIAKPGQTKVLQELFLRKFYENQYFREGMVAIMKELLVNYVSEMDPKGFHTIFRHYKLDKLVPMIRRSEHEPTEEMISVFPYIVEGGIEVHYVRTGKIEIVLYNQKGVRSFKQSPFSIICLGSPQTPEENLYQALIIKDQVEILEKLGFVREEAPNKKLEDTVYMSMDSQNGLEQDITKVKATINREFLLNKIKDVNFFMSRHTDKLVNIFKPKDNNTITTHAVSHKRTVSGASTPQENSASQSRNQRYAAPTSFPGPLGVTATTQSDKGKPSHIPHHYNIVVPPHNPHKHEAASQSPLIRTNSPSLNHHHVINKLSKPAAPKDNYKVGYPAPYGTSAPSSNALYSILNGTRTGSGGAHKTQTNHNNVSYTIQNNGNTNTSVNTTLNHMSPQKSKNSSNKQREEDMDTEKENKETTSVLNVRSPLKRIVVYTHQKEAAFANVEKEALAFEAASKASPKYARTEKLIFEDTAI